ncbi:MAG TPA: hypothetical protein VD813_14035, partial [Pseudonocardia sp.]|nr:hypothetical protein [Pseudonocardia sp.]
MSCPTAARGERAPGSRLRAPDAFFVHAGGPAGTPRLGAVLLLGTGAGAVPIERLAEQVRERVRSRAPTLPMLSRRLDVRPGRWPRWRPVADVDPDAHVGAVVVGPGRQVTWGGVLREFFDADPPAHGPPWRLRLLRDEGD